MRRLTCSAACVALLSLVAAAPATRPTTRPTMSDRDSVAYFAKLRPLTFRVPKTWEPADDVPKAADGVFFLFRLDGTPTRKSAPPRAGTPRLSVTIFWPCERQAQFEEMTKERRQRMAAERPGAELIEDGATEIGGGPAWRLRWRYDATPTKTGDDGKRKAAGKPTTVIQETILLNRFYAASEVTLSGDAATFDRLRPVVDAIAASIAPVAK